MKNPLGLNQAEVIAGLALELMKSSKRVINPVTKQPFRVKLGRENTISTLSKDVSFLSSSIQASTRDPQLVVLSGQRIFNTVSLVTLSTRYITRALQTITRMIFLGQPHHHYGRGK
jgi:hypothetical protein